jgi:hypothetical protein
MGPRSLVDEIMNSKSTGPYIGCPCFGLGFADLGLLFIAVPTCSSFPVDDPITSLVRLVLTGFIVDK